ncbi:calcium-binding protein [Paraglaciecola sp. 20A4]|uniref:calcium-binding protein n=1 Tax=Paraglaciecola sp. 20A4 TaxID=2687288 RepID=UPI00140A5081|nr:calcium-binding protein [Paraglaciecola sp. 20A4]
MKKIIMLGLLFMSSTSAFATTDIFTALDVNEDNMLSVQEVKIDTTLTAIFTDLDNNKDGFVSKQEFSVLQQH